MTKTFINRLTSALVLASFTLGFVGFAPALAQTVTLNTEATSTFDFSVNHLRACTTSLVCVNEPEVTADVMVRGARLDAYFAKRDMPLAGYGAEFVIAADKYNLDWRLLPAIGVRESSGGKHLMNNNPFGWGSAKIPFKNFDEAIVEVTKHLAGEYPSTAKYYKDRTLEKKLWYYNGSVMPAYTGEVIGIMNKF